MEAHSDSAVVPWGLVEVANALGKAVVHGKVPLGRALEIWDARKLSSPTNNYLSGSFPHWRSAPLRRTEKCGLTWEGPRKKAEVSNRTRYVVSRNMWRPADNIHWNQRSGGSGRHINDTH